jgi:hypothetical protein
MRRFRLLPAQAKTDIGGFNIYQQEGFRCDFLGFNRDLSKDIYLCTYPTLTRCTTHRRYCYHFARFSGCYMGPPGHLSTEVSCLECFLDFLFIALDDHIIKPKFFILLPTPFIEFSGDGGIWIRSIQALDVRVGKGIIEDEGEWFRC